MFAADFALGEALWSILAIGMFIIWFWLLISVFGDLFRDHELSGVAKAAWMIGVVIAPYLGVFVYLIVRGDGMAKRSLAAQQAAQSQVDAYIRQTAGGGGGAAAEIAHAK